MTEADDAASTPGNALANVAYQVLRGETHGVLGMYERAALTMGISYDLIEQVEEVARIELKRKGRLFFEFHATAAETARTIADIAMRAFTINDGYETVATTFAALAEANAEDLSWRNEDGTDGDAALAVLALQPGQSIDLGAPGSPGGSFIVSRVVS